MNRIEIDRKRLLIGDIDPEIIHSKSEKVCGTAFSGKKFAEKVRKSGRHIWAIWG